MKRVESGLKGGNFAQGSLKAQTDECVAKTCRSCPSELTNKMFLVAGLKIIFYHFRRNKTARQQMGRAKRAIANK